MRSIRMLLLPMICVFTFAAGCKKNAVDSSAFKSALNSYYAEQQDCLFTTTVKFPAQADTSNDDQTRGYDALTDAGLLTRTPQEKKRFLIGSKQVNDYDISPKGRTLWTPDPSQPGYGNFCYGHPEVVAIDSFTPSDDTQTRFNVTYHLDVASTPEWANSSEVKTAFPKLAADTSARQVATATLVKSDNGWLVQNVQAAPVPQNQM